MCSLCAALGGSRYWTDAAGHAEFTDNEGKLTLRKEREKRVTFLAQILSVYGIEIRDWGGNSYVLTGRDGTRHNAYNLAGIWSIMDSIGEKAGDPLDPLLLDRMSGTARDDCG